MKDEAVGQIITEFVGLRSKMYSYVKDNIDNHSTAKGIRKNVIKHYLKCDDYKKHAFQ